METEFTLGTIVRHKTSDFGMVVIATTKNSVTVRYFNKKRDAFIEDKFSPFELTVMDEAKLRPQWLDKDAGKLPDDNSET